MLRYYDLYQKLQLQFHVLLMMGAMDTRNMQSNFAINTYLQTVASCWILLIYLSRLSTNVNVNSSTKPYTGARQGLTKKYTECERPTILITVVPYQ